MMKILLYDELLDSIFIILDYSIPDVSDLNFKNIRTSLYLKLPISMKSYILNWIDNRNIYIMHGYSIMNIIGSNPIIISETNVDIGIYLNCKNWTILEYKSNKYEEIHRSIAIDYILNCF